MTFRLPIGLTAAACLLAGVMNPAPAPAAAPVAGYTGTARSSVAGCPYLVWRLAKHPGGKVTGIAYYSDLSGLSMVDGSVDPEGHFTLNLKSDMGKGPVGTVTGTRKSDGSVTAQMVGEGCANMTLNIKPVQDMNFWHGGEG